MKKINILYWIFTILFGGLMMFSAIPDIISHPMAVKGMHEGLGYPLYFIPFIGVAKALGVIAIIVPGFPRLKEWAYAGLIFDLIGATYSVIAIGGAVGDWIMMPVFIVLGFLSYAFYHKRVQASANASNVIKGGGVRNVVSA